MLFPQEDRILCRRKMLQYTAIELVTHEKNYLTKEPLKWHSQRRSFIFRKVSLLRAKSQDTFPAFVGWYMTTSVMHRKCPVRVYVLRGDNLAKYPSAKPNKLDNSSNICTKPTILTAFLSSIKQIDTRCCDQRRKTEYACFPVPEEIKKNICWCSISVISTWKGRGLPQGFYDKGVTCLLLCIGQRCRCLSRTWDEDAGPQWMVCVFFLALPLSRSHASFI